MPAERNLIEHSPVEKETPTSQTENPEGAIFNVCDHGFYQIIDYLRDLGSKCDDCECEFSYQSFVCDLKKSYAERNYTKAVSIINILNLISENPKNTFLNCDDASKNTSFNKSLNKLSLIISEKIKPYFDERKDQFVLIISNFYFIINNFYCSEARIFMLQDITLLQADYAKNSLSNYREFQSLLEKCVQELDNEIEIEGYEKGHATILLKNLNGIYVYISSKING